MLRRASQKSSKGAPVGLRDWLKRRAAASASNDPESRRVQIILSPGDRRPRLAAPPGKRSTTPEDCWVPAGQPVTVAGHTIDGGLLYVGRNLPSISGWRGVEPALIDPRLPVDTRRPDVGGAGLDYWPSYSEIPPASRAAYLAWLATDRKDAGTPVGYVFLFFYGLERRLLADAAALPGAWDEAGVICAEVERLLGIYGSNSSFMSYASRFLDTVATLRSAPREVYELPPPVPATSWEIPIRLKIGLAQLALEGKPVPNDWALAWVRAHPEARLRTPAARCPEEFTRLFAIRYRERFGGGLTIKPNKTKLVEYYRPASASFGGQVRIPLGDLPDIAALTAPVRRLTEVTDRCCDELDAYSRFLGKNPEGRGSPQAVALLPDELAASQIEGATAALFDWVDEQLGARDQTLVDGNALASRWPSGREGKLAKADAVALAQLLGKRGFGMEPDVRFGGPIVGDRPAVLFRLPAGAPISPSSAYAAGAVLLHLAATVSGADGGVTEAEERHLAAHLEAALHLSEAERRRLEAHLMWLLAAGGGLAGVKRRIAALDTRQRSHVGQFLVTVAAIDGTVTPEEIDILMKIYRLLELDPDEVYRQVHAIATTSAPATEPVTIRPAAPATTGYAIPQPPTRPEDSFALDTSRIEQRLAETAAVSALLSAIFVGAEDRPVAPSPLAGRANGEDAGGNESIAGLDVAHSGLVRALAQRPRWTRAELEALASERGLMPDGALDAINEAAIDAVGEPFCDGEEELNVNEQVLQGMLS